MTRKLLVAAAAALAFGGAGVSLAPTASAGPYCDFFDVFGVCDVRDAVKACWDAPEVCEQYSEEPSQYQ